ncbi:MAG: hypothetical protein Q4D59_04775, partial [Erysipelotrichaceae bacterium]|nr:hypothetical protein [Erysipelotrichaceae bacterium]
MTEAKEEKKYRSIAHASIRRLILLALFIVLGTCAAAGISLYRSEMESYTDFAYAFLDFYGSLVHLTESEKTGQPVLKSYIESGTVDEKYGEIGQLLSAGRSKAGFTDLYIVVPRENDILYIIRDLDFDGSYEYTEEELAWFEKNWFWYSRPYEPGEKEIMMYEMTDPKEGILYTNLHRSDKDRLATALSAINDYKPEVIALIGADISLNNLYHQITRMWLYIILAFAVVLAIAILIYYNAIRKQIIEPVVRLKDATGQIVQNISSGEE